MGYENLLFEARDRIILITVNRPDSLNALNYRTLEELEDAVNRAQRDRETKVIMITGMGKKAFIAGADLTLVQIRFLKTLYFGQHNEDGILINPTMPLNTLSLGLLRAYKQSFDPVILDSKMNA